METITTLTTKVSITINHKTRELQVYSESCHGFITIPADVKLGDTIRLSALAIIALTPMARKIAAHEPWFAEVVADPGVREFVERAAATYAARESI